MPRSNYRRKRSYEQQWRDRAAVNQFRPDGIPPVFGLQADHLNADTLLVALALSGSLTSREASRIIGVRPGNAYRLFDRLRAKAIVAQAVTLTRRGRPFTLDQAHPGMTHLVEYLRCVSPLARFASLPEVRPFCGTVEPTPAKPTPLFTSSMRTLLLLALAVAPVGLKRQQFLAAVGLPDTHAVQKRFASTVRFLVMRGLVASFTGRLDPRTLNVEFPGMMHLREFLRAHADRFHPRLVEGIAKFRN